MSLVDRLVSLYAPHVCVGCGLEGALLCDHCYASLPVLPECCYRCRARSVRGRTCPTCRKESPLVSVHSMTAYEGIAKDLLRALKFGRAMAAAEEIAGRMAERFGPAIAGDMLIMPVPTARSRVRRRGYDQSVLIAKALAQRTSGNYAPLLMRLGSQEQKGAGRQQRREQLHGAYLLRRPERVKNARILLVDDVLTTGSTLEEVAKVLKSHGARVVGAVVFARA